MLNGAAALAVETTNSSGSPTNDSEYRWNLAPMFVRGAARQFDLPWEWYMAEYMNGFRRNGEWLDNAACGYPFEAGPIPFKKNRGPEYGVSANLMRRLYYFAYVSGANVTQPEEWSAYFLAWDDAAGKTVLTRRGRDYAAFHDFAAANPGRGAPWTPVAVCVPLSRGYTAFGGSAFAERRYDYTQSDLMSNAVFFTLVPGFARARAMKAGVETNLHNSRFAHMYDVICPDASSQSSETVLDVMKSYKALVVAGEFDDPKVERCLAEYEKAGGRVVRLPRVADAIDAELTKQLKGGLTGQLKGGRIRFPEVEAVFKGLQKDYFPFKVQGDCLYGANRTERGWWLWVFNNRGVTKFADEPESVDHAFDAEISVSVADGRAAARRLGTVKELLTGAPVPVADGTFSHRVSAVNLAIFEIYE